MNKLRNELMWMKIQINSYYGANNFIQFQEEYSDKKKTFYKIQNRVLKIKRIYGYF
jgi:hypothetical protein